MTIVLQPYSAMISMTSSITTYQNEHYTTSNKNRASFTLR
uniref:Uncharacterized protein n=1 Tax=Staphylococcus haemolyticus TaxID=1283 RepID=A0A023UEU1_STAHA|nr:hypothetical protein SHP0105 [Staphylococcus haemolyticus]